VLCEEDLAAEVQAWLREKLMAVIESQETDLLATGILDSLTLVQLLLYLEQHFDLKIAMEQLEIEDLRSVRTIARLVAREKRAVAAA
jgi:acyl carrier protein